MTQLVQGGRPLARFRVLGFPVTIDASFAVIVALLGWYPGVGLQHFVVWLVIVPVAVLVHELGHAVVARTTGAEPTIALAGLGGLTSYAPPARLSRARSVAISVAGPAVGIVIGGALLVYGRTVGIDSALGRDVVNIAIYTTLGWSVLNLLPMLPLDGGQTLRELLPGSPARRQVRAAMVSVVVGVLVGLVAWRAGLTFGLLMAAFFVVSNVMTVRAARDLDKVDVNQRLVQLLWSGARDDAHDLLAETDRSAGAAGASVAAGAAAGGAAGGAHPWLRTTVLAAGAGAEADAARAQLEAAVARQAPDPQAAAMLLLVHRSHEDWAAARELLTGPAARVIDPANVVAVQQVAYGLGARRASAELGDAYLVATDDHDRVGHPDAAAVIAYNSACGYALAGEPALGLAAFIRAADLGFTDLTMVDSDEDLSPLRPLPGYDAARATIRSRALAVDASGSAVDGG